MKTWMKILASALLALLALSVLPAQAEELSGTGWSYSGTVLTITADVADYSLAPSSSSWFIGTPFERAGIDSAVTEIVVEEGVTSLGNLAFYGMSRLTRVSFPSTLRRIGSGTFRNCSSLQEVTIPASVTSIGHSAFFGCSGLTKITFEGLPPTIGRWDAYYDFSNPDIYVFSGCTADVYYKPYAAWTDAKIAEFSKKCYPTWHPLCDDYGACGANAQWYLIDGDQLVIRGSGDMTDYASNASPWQLYRNQITSVSVGAGITRIGSHAFSGGGAQDVLTGISLPATVTSIGESAFDHCAALTSISLPDSITRIERDAFYGCCNLVSIDLPQNLETIGGSAFGSCSALRALELPDTVVELGMYALANAESLQTIRLSAGIKTLSDGVLANTGLETVEIPQGVESISASAFSGSAHLRSVKIPISVQTIAQNAFTGHPETLVLLCHADSCAAQFAAQQSITAEIEPHAEMTLAGTAPTCTEDGITDGVQCTVCERILVEQEVLPPTGHDYAKPIFDWAEDGSGCVVRFTCLVCGDEQNPGPAITSKRVKEAGCVTPGETEYTATVEFGVGEIPDPGNPDETITAPSVYEDTLLLADIPALGHTEVVLPGIAPTCIEPGKKDYIFCEVCGEELQTADELAPLGHSEAVVAEALEPTCTEEGHTQELACSVCGVVLEAARPIAATGHTEYISAEAVAPGCVDTGLTKEIRCSVCQEVLAPAQIVPALGHTPSTDAAVPPACESTGWTEGSHCAVCGEVLTAQTVVPATGHTPVTDAAVPPTDREPGWTEGSHCAVCGKTLTEQTVLPANFTWEGDTVVAYNAGLEDVVIPDGAAALGDTLFKHNTAIRTVRVPQSVSALGMQTFFGCTGLTDVWLPDHLTGISAQTFYNVPARMHVNAGSATAIALSYCNVPFTTEDGMTLRYRVTSAAGTPTAVWLVAYASDAESIDLPGEIGSVPLTQLQSGAFDGCARLREIRIPDSVTAIADDAFDGIDAELIIRSSIHAYAKTWAESNGFAWAHDMHTQDVLDAVPPTCVENGLTEGLWCSACGEILVEQTAVEATGHTPVVLEAVEPTCTEDGLTEGSACAVCGEILVEQTAVEATGHTPAVMEAVEPTCTEDGLTEGSACAVCGEILVGQRAVKAPGHTAVTDAAVPPTCTAAGLTEGSHCTVCHQVLTAQEAVPETGHNAALHEAVEPTCMEAGRRAYYTCDACGRFLAADGGGFTEVEEDSWLLPKLSYHRMQDNACTMCGERFDFTSMDVLTLPAGLKRIEEEAFRGSMAQVFVAPEGCLSIGRNAFAGCTELRYAVLPAAFAENAGEIFGDNVPVLIVPCEEETD